MALLDELWDRKVSPDRGVEWVVCDGDMAIEGAVEIAYPGVKIQRCISSRTLGRFWRSDTQVREMGSTEAI